MHDERQHHVFFMPSGQRGSVPAGTLLMDAARQLGVELESICNGQGTCHKCRVRIESGDFPKHGITSSPQHLSPLTVREQQVLGQEGGAYRLACHARVEGDLLVFVPESSLAHKQIIRKSANALRRIAVNPAVRPLFVTVQPAALDTPTGDWERLQTALAEQHDCTGVQIDLHALRRLQGALRAGDWQVTVILRDNRIILDVHPRFVEAVYGLAVDVGTTTVVAHLCDLRTGAVLATEAAMNPQVAYGEDVMSRISYVMLRADGLETLHNAIIETLNTLAAACAVAANVSRDAIYDMVAVGNTTMTHLLLGISPVEIGHAPFALAQRDSADVCARDLNLALNPAASVHVLPALGGYVGADTLGVLLAETPYTREVDVSLVVDIGTNAEVVIGNRHWMLAASSPTGPAFEGAQITHGMRAAPGAVEKVRVDAQTGEPRLRIIGVEAWSDAWETLPDILPRGICGSGMIDVIAELFLAGILLPDGRFNPNTSSSRVHWQDDVGAYVLVPAEQTATGQPIVITQRDVRNIQLAKGALYAGIKLLMAQAGVERVDRIVLAGAFGSHIDTERAMILGLIPDCDLKRVYAVGNAAGDGARIALLNVHKRQEARQVVEHVTHVELAANPDFQRAFVEALHFPHASDAFPHLTHVLPEQSVRETRKTVVKRRMRTTT